MKYNNESYDVNYCVCIWDTGRQDILSFFYYPVIRFRIDQLSGFPLSSNRIVKPLSGASLFACHEFRVFILININFKY